MNAALPLYQVDAFSDRPFAGNPAAVCLLPEARDAVWMQRVAAEMNLSETVFVQKPTDDRALARLRIFTTQNELKLAGHPVVGTWFLLAELGVVPAQEGGVHVMQQTGAAWRRKRTMSPFRPRCISLGRGRDSSTRSSGTWG